MKTGTFVLIIAFITGHHGAYGQQLVLNASNDESKISYTVVHPLHRMEAVSTAAVYRLEYDSSAANVRSVSASVDVTSFNSGNSNRDSHAMEVIDALTYPDARFVSTAIVRRGDSLSVSGKLEFHGILKDILVPAKLTASDKKLTVDAAFVISMTDFKIERPSLLMIPVEDSIRFALTAVFPLP
jgi:hypothetical protein